LVVAVRGERRQMILETLARMLEENQGAPIRTAALAKSVGVSEAALYRHFPSKAKMLEALIEFIEETLFTRINIILAEEKSAKIRLQQILTLFLTFAEKNPGITRLLQGDILVGETKQLHDRVAQLFNRLETQIKQILREGEVQGLVKCPITETARLLLAVGEGRISHYVRSGFKGSPIDGWAEQWQILEKGIFEQI